MNRKFLFYSCILLLVGCSSVRIAREAQEPSNIPPGERTVSASEVGLNKGSKLTMQRAQEIALTCHPSIVQSRQNLVISEKQFDDAISCLLPSINVNVSGGRATSNITANSESGKTNPSYSAGISLTQLIYDFGKTPASVRYAYENMLAAREDFKTTENNIIYNVKKAYYDLIKQKALVKIAQETVKQYQVHLDEAKSLFEVGRRIKYDVTKAQVDLGNAQINLVSSQSDFSKAVAALANSLGLAEVPEDLVVEETFPKKIDYNFEALIKVARENQPELVASIARERAASATIDSAIAGLFPSLSLGSNYGWSGGSFPLVWNWNLSAVLKSTIFNGFQNINQIDKDVASLRIARAKRQEVEQRIYLDLKCAIAQLEDAKQRLSLTNLVILEAKENLNLVEERYKIGRASSVELTDAMVSYTRAKVNQIQANFDYQIAEALIEKITGKEEARKK